MQIFFFDVSGLGIILGYVPSAIYLSLGRQIHTLEILIEVVSLTRVKVENYMLYEYSYCK